MQKESKQQSMDSLSVSISEMSLSPKSKATEALNEALQSARSARRGHRSRDTIFFTKGSRGSSRLAPIKLSHSNRSQSDTFQILSLQQELITIQKERDELFQSKTKMFSKLIKAKKLWNECLVQQEAVARSLRSMVVNLRKNCRHLKAENEKLRAQINTDQMKRTSVIPPEHIIAALQKYVSSLQHELQKYGGSTPVGVVCGDLSLEIDQSRSSQTKLDLIEDGSGKANEVLEQSLSTDNLAKLVDDTYDADKEHKEHQILIDYEDDDEDDDELDEYSSFTEDHMELTINCESSGGLRLSPLASLKPLEGEVTPLSRSAQDAFIILESDNDDESDQEIAHNQPPPPHINIEEVGPRISPGRLFRARSKQSWTESDMVQYSEEMKGGMIELLKELKMKMVHDNNGHNLSSE